MTAHRRAWISRAGVVVALAASALFALPTTPASADDPTVTITGVNASLNAGQTTTLSFSVKNNNGGVLGGDTSFNIAVSSSFNELQCQGNCDFTDTIDLGQSKNFSVTLRAGNVAAGQTKSGRVQITAEVGGDDASATRNITVRGPEAPQVQTVAEVAGKVTAEGTGDPVSGASVRLTDRDNHSYTTTTNSSGSYRFNGSAGSPITPGPLTIRATKDGINDSKTVNGSAGQRLSNQGIQLALEVAPTATPDASAEPTEEATVEEGAEEDGATPEGGQPDTNNAAEEGGLGSSWLLILAGGLLVALGVGAIVLLVMRRKENDEGDDDEDGPNGPRGGAPIGGAGGYRGGNDATRVATRAGAGADPTMVNRQSLADAPTMMHSSPLVEEFPDPYGAPLPGPQGYPGGQQDDWGANGYGNAPASGAGYGNAPGSGAGYGNAPASGAGYGNTPGSGAGYGAPVSGAGYRDGPAGYAEQFDEPTGRYTGGRGAEEYAPAADPYETGSYRPSSGAGHGGYEADPQYGQPDPQYGQPDPQYGQADGYGGAGYGAERGYEEPRTGAGYDRGDDGYGAGTEGYGAERGYGQQAGYEADRGYDQPSTGGGYDQQRGGYDAPGGYDDRGYDQQQQGGAGYYDDSPRAGGHSRSAAPPQPGRGERRSLDWLDD